MCDRMKELISRPKAVDCNKDEQILKLNNELAILKEKFSLASSYAAKIVEMEK
jgi:hypothetical protein